MTLLNFLLNLLSKFFSTSPEKLLEQEMKELKELCLLKSMFPQGFDERNVAWMALDGTYSHAINTRVIRIIQLVGMTAPVRQRRAIYILVRFVKDLERQSLLPAGKAGLNSLHGFIQAASRRPRMTTTNAAGQEAVRMTTA